jgi:hypothetical protein
MLFLQYFSCFHLSSPLLDINTGLQTGFFFFHQQIVFAIKIQLFIVETREMIVMLNFFHQKGVTVIPSSFRMIVFRL